MPEEEKIETEQEAVAAADADAETSVEDTTPAAEEPAEEGTGDDDTEKAA